MPLEPFTRKFEDNSIDTGFQFTFYCDICSQKFHKSKFVKLEISKKAGILRDAGRLSGMATKIGTLGITGFGFGGRGQMGETSGAAEKGTETVISQRFGQMSPQWHKEHEIAFDQAQQEAKMTFKCCPGCKKWACENDWNEQAGLCLVDSPRVGKQIFCPQCSKLTGEGKFCNNCGASLTLKCPKCKVQSQAGTKFCGECGTKL